jgi:hypothetical protein
MSDQPRTMNVAGRHFGPTPEIPEGMDIPAEAADTAWRQSYGSFAAFHALLAEHAAGTIDLLAEDQTRLTPHDAPAVAAGDDRFTVTGGETYGDTAGPASMQTQPPRPQFEPEPLQPLSEQEHARLEELRALTAPEPAQADEMAALSEREFIGR